MTKGECGESEFTFSGCMCEGSFHLFFSLHTLAHSCMVLLVNVGSFCLLNLIYYTILWKGSQGNEDRDSSLDSDAFFSWT